MMSKSSSVFDGVKVRDSHKKRSAPSSDEHEEKEVNDVYRQHHVIVIGSCQCLSLQEYITAFLSILIILYEYQRSGMAVEESVY